MAAWLGRVLEKAAYAADCVMDAREVLGYRFRGEEMVAVLAVNKVVTREVRTRENYFVVYAIELYMLQAPTFIDAFGD